MTYKTCERLILTKKERLNGEALTAFYTDMAGKLDIFLLNDRITNEQYHTLLKLMSDEIVA